MSALFTPDNPDKKVILSIDGGGMRGLISLQILAAMEEQSDQPAHELFDMVAGTSTGAIIAAGLALKMTVAEILKVYREALPAAFGNGGLRRAFHYLRTGFRYLYPLEPFYERLQPFAEKAKIRTISDINPMVILLTTKDVRTGNTYYITNCGSGKKFFGEWPLVGAVAASAAAPIYFPPVAGNLIDGGVGVYGNPCFRAAVEAMDYIGNDRGFVDNNVVLVSLGTGAPPETTNNGAAGNFRLWDWLPYIIGEGINDSSFQQVIVTRKLYKERLDFRRYNPALSKQAAADLGVDVGKLDPAKLGLASTSPEELDLMEAIGKAYAAQLNFERSDFVPWQEKDDDEGKLGGRPLPTINPVVDWPEPIC